MRIDISELRKEQGSFLTFEGREKMAAIQFMGEEIRFPEPLQIEGSVTRTDVGYVVSGTVCGSMERQCGRCLERYTSDFSARFDMVFRPMETPPDVNRSSEEEHAPEEEVIFFRGNFIDLKDLIMESVIMEIPMKALCREDCLGLCPICGQNLNQGTCHCAGEKVDERMAALKQLLNND